MLGRGEEAIVTGDTMKKKRSALYIVWILLLLCLLAGGLYLMAVGAKEYVPVAPYPETMVCLFNSLS